MQTVAYQDASTALQPTGTIPQQLAVAGPHLKVESAMQTVLMVVAAAVKAGVVRLSSIVISPKDA